MSDSKEANIKQGFYQYYLQEHQDINCRRMHFVGTSFGVYGITKAISTKSSKPILKGIVIGYGCAWVGHYFFEHNRPATFKYPVQSFIGDWKMYVDIWRGRISMMDKNRDKI